MNFFVVRFVLFLMQDTGRIRMIGLSPFVPPCSGALVRVPRHACAAKAALNSLLKAQAQTEAPTGINIADRDHVGYLNAWSRDRVRVVTLKVIVGKQKIQVAR